MNTANSTANTAAIHADPDPFIGSSNARDNALVDRLVSISSDPIAAAIHAREAQAEYHQIADATRWERSHSLDKAIWAIDDAIAQQEAGRARVNDMIAEDVAAHVERVAAPKRRWWSSMFGGR